MAALDQMDYLMHQGEAGPGHAAGAGPGFHGLPQHQGCPYFRSQQQQQQHHHHGQQHPQHHGPGLPPMHFDAAPFHAMPHPHPHSHPLHPHSALPPQQQQSPGQHLGHRGAYHLQPQQQLQQTQAPAQSQPQPPPSQSHSQSQPQTQPPQQQLPPLQPPTLPYPQTYPHPHSHHSPYDPVHASGAVWYPSAPPSSVSVWSSPAALHPYQLQPSHARPSASDSHFGGPSGHSGSTSRGGSGAGSGAGLVQPHQQYLPPPEHFLFHGYHRGAAYPNSSIVLPMPPSLSNSNHSARHGQSDQNQAGPPSQPSQPNPPSRRANSHSPPVAMSNERAAPPTGRGLTLPSLNPNSSPTPAGHPSNTRESSSREPSPPAGAPSLLNRPSAFRFPDDSPRPSNRGSGDGPSPPQLPLPSDYAGMEFPRPDAYMADRSGLPLSSGPPANPGVPSLSSRRHQLLARRLGHADRDSDEDFGSSADEDDHMLRYMDDFGVGASHFRAMIAEDHIRAAQLLRGQVPSKRVASKKAIGQLQSVELDSLSETERTCVICYNDFGQSSPEGIIEAPLRLPKCQHVFGDHCIKKWFEESDSCPYCRDKVPSEAAVAPSLRTYQTLFRMRSRMPAGNTQLGTTDDSIVRILAQQEQREFARARARQEAGSENATPRPFQPRERRSPPSETMENRRRTRARHSSFHPSYPAGFANGPGSRASMSSVSSHTAGTPAFGQHSPTRVTPPSGSPWPGFFSPDPNRALTPHPARQSMPGDHRLFYTSADSGHPANPGSSQDPPVPGSGAFRMGNANMQMSSPNPYIPNVQYGSPPPAMYLQHPPSHGQSPFQNPANSGNMLPNNAGAESQMQ